MSRQHGWIIVASAARRKERRKKSKVFQPRRNLWWCIFSEWKNLASGSAGSGGGYVSKSWEKFFRWDWFEVFFLSTNKQRLMMRLDYFDRKRLIPVDLGMWSHFLYPLRPFCLSWFVSVWLLVVGCDWSDWSRTDGYEHRLKPRKPWRISLERTVVKWLVWTPSCHVFFDQSAWDWVITSFQLNPTALLSREFFDLR